MSKILKNTTISDIELSTLARTIPASGQITIPVGDYLLLGSEDSITELTPLINSGDIVINDGSNDLSSDEAIEYAQYPDQASNIRFTPTSSIAEINVQDAIGSGVNTALNTPRYGIPLIYNGVVSNNEFIGYSNLLPGDETPIIIPVDSEITGYTFSNSRADASYTIELRKNSETATPFNTTSKITTKNFIQSELSEEFAAGDSIFVKYLDDGVNASDVGILLTFKAIL